MKIIIALLYSTLLIACAEKRNIKTGLEGKLLPSFNVLLVDSTKLNTNKLPTDKPIVLFFMSPYCPYCKAQTEEIISEINSLSNIRLYILTSLPFQPLKDYYYHYKLNKYPNIMVAQDFDSDFVNYFKITSVPYIVIYNKNKTLKQVLVGKVGTSLIKDLALQ